MGAPIARLLSGDAGGFSSARLVFLTVGLTLLLIGVFTRNRDLEGARPFGQRLRVLYRGLALLILNFLVLLLVAEAAAAMYLKLRPLPLEPSAAAPALLEEWASKMAATLYYAGQPWATAYFREHLVVINGPNALSYRPYVLWRSTPFAGETINLDENGIRRTPGAACHDSPYKVFAFGGSTMWGYGAPDWMTIPAYLQNELTARVDRPVCVVNFGELAYVSTQSVIELIRQLQWGNVPDLVVFYDGFNDIQVGNKFGQAGVHFFLDSVQDRMDGKHMRAWQQDAKAASSLFTLAERVAGMRTGDQPSTGGRGLNGLAADSGSLARSIVRGYLVNYSAVEAIGNQYGFEAAFFLQPLRSTSGKELTEDEKRFIGERDSERQGLIQAVYAQLKEHDEKMTHFNYLGDLFDGYESQLWMDEVHVVPIGNEMVARRMAEILRRRTLPAGEPR